VVWTSPLHTNGHLIGYSVSYSIRDRPETSHLVNTTSDVTSIIIDQLQATTHYKFEVFAWTKVGAGPSRIATIQSGIEPVLPNPPTKLAITNIEPFSVVLQFTPGFDGNSSITKWVVEVSKLLLKLLGYQLSFIILKQFLIFCFFLFLFRHKLQETQHGLLCMKKVILKQSH